MRYFRHGFHLNKQNRLEALLKKNNKLTISRSRRITAEFLGLKVLVHNGKSFKEILVIQDMLRHKFGEFAHTRKTGKHESKKKKKSVIAEISI